MIIIKTYSITMAALSFKTHPRRKKKTLTLAVSRPLTLSHQGPNMPPDTMSNSTWLSYLAGLLWDYMPDRTAGEEEEEEEEANRNCEADM